MPEENADHDQERDRPRLRKRWAAHEIRDSARRQHWPQGIVGIEKVHRQLVVELKDDLRFSPEQVARLSARGVRIEQHSSTGASVVTMSDAPELLMALAEGCHPGGLPSIAIDLRAAGFVDGDNGWCDLDIRIARSPSLAPSIQRFAARGSAATQAVEYVHGLVMSVAMSDISINAFLEYFDHSDSLGGCGYRKLTDSPPGTIDFVGRFAWDEASGNGEIQVAATTATQFSLKLHRRGKLVRRHELFDSVLAHLLTFYLWCPWDLCQDRAVSVAPTLKTAFLEGTSKLDGALDTVVKRLVPVASQDDLDLLTSIIRAAQVNPPADKHAFVRGVNLLLDVLSVRIRSERGDCGRLRVAPNGSIQLTRSQHKGTGAFKSIAFTLVSVPRTTAGNRYTKRDPNSGPS